MNRKVALVTGGTGGIGKAIVTELARQDYIVCLQYSSNRDEAERIRAVSPNIHVFQHDFSDADFAFIDEIAYQFGRIDVLVNCAGIMADESFMQMTPKGFDELFSINVRAPFLLTAKVFELMKANGYGRILISAPLPSNMGWGATNRFNMQRVSLLLNR
jgi:CylG protein